MFKQQTQTNGQTNKNVRKVKKSSEDEIKKREKKTFV